MSNHPLKKNSKLLSKQEQDNKIVAEALALIKEYNADFGATRRITPLSAKKVVLRSLAQSTDQSYSERHYKALNALSNFANLLQRNKSLTASAENTDLLPIAHPRSTKPHVMAPHQLQITRSRYWADDPRVQDPLVSSLLASAFSQPPNSARRDYAVARLHAMGSSKVPTEALVAAFSDGANDGFWRRQLRDSDGRFAFMGGGLSKLVRMADGVVRRLTGRTVSTDSSNNSFTMELPDGRLVKTKADEAKSVKAIIPSERGDAGYSKSPASYNSSDVVVNEEDLEFVEAPDGWDVNPDYAPNQVDVDYYGPDEDLGVEYQNGNYRVKKFKNARKAAAHKFEAQQKREADGEPVVAFGKGQEDELDPVLPLYFAERREPDAKTFAVAQTWNEILDLIAKDEQRYQEGEEPDPNRPQNVGKLVPSKLRPGNQVDLADFEGQGAQIPKQRFLQAARRSKYRSMLKKFREQGGDFPLNPERSHFVLDDGTIIDTETGIVLRDSQGRANPDAWQEEPVPLTDEQVEQAEPTTPAPPEAEEDTPRRPRRPRRLTPPDDAPRPFEIPEREPVAEEPVAELPDEEPEEVEQPEARRISVADVKVGDVIKAKDGNFKRVTRRSPTDGGPIFDFDDNKREMYDFEDEVEIQDAEVPEPEPTPEAEPVAEAQDGELRPVGDMSDEDLAAEQEALRAENGRYREAFEKGDPVPNTRNKIIVDRLGEIRDEQARRGEQPEAPEGAESAPEGFYDVDRGEYQPMGAEFGQESEDFTDDPAVLAEEYPTRDLVAALREAVVGNPDEPNELGLGFLDFADGLEPVPAEALYNALKEQGEDADVILDGLYKQGKPGEARPEVLPDEQANLGEDAPEAPVADEAEEGELPALLEGLSEEEKANVLEDNNVDEYLADNKVYGDDEVPEGYYKINEDNFVLLPEDVPQDAPDNVYLGPIGIANDFEAEELKQELRRALEPQANVPGYGVLAYQTPEGENYFVNVPAEALRDALKLQDEDVEELIDEIYAEGFQGQDNDAPTPEQVNDALEGENVEEVEVEAPAQEEADAEAQEQPAPEEEGLPPADIAAEGIADQIRDRNLLRSEGRGRENLPEIPDEYRRQVFIKLLAGLYADADGNPLAVGDRVIHQNPNKAADLGEGVVIGKVQGNIGGLQRAGVVYVDYVRVRYPNGEVRKFASRFQRHVDENIARERFEAEERINWMNEAEMAEALAERRKKPRKNEQAPSPEQKEEAQVAEQVVEKVEEDLVKPSPVGDKFDDLDNKEAILDGLRIVAEEYLPKFRNTKAPRALRYARRDLDELVGRLLFKDTDTVKRMIAEEYKLPEAIRGIERFKNGDPDRFPEKYKAALEVEDALRGLKERADKLQEEIIEEAAVELRARQAEPFPDGFLQVGEPEELLDDDAIEKIDAQLEQLIKYLPDNGEGGGRFGRVRYNFPDPEGQIAFNAADDFRKAIQRNREREAANKYSIERILERNNGNLARIGRALGMAAEDNGPGAEFYGNLRDAFMPFSNQLAEVPEKIKALKRQQQLENLAQPLPDGLIKSGSEINKDDLNALLDQIVSRLPRPEDVDDYNANPVQARKKLLDFQNNLDKANDVFEVPTASIGEAVKYLETEKALINSNVLDGVIDALKTQRGNIAEQIRRAPIPEFGGPELTKVDVDARAQERVAARENVFQVDSELVNRFGADGEVYQENPVLEPYKDEYVEFFNDAVEKPLALLSYRARQALQQYVGGNLKADSNRPLADKQNLINLAFRLEEEEKAYQPNRGQLGGEADVFRQVSSSKAFSVRKGEELTDNAGNPTGWVKDIVGGGGINDTQRFTHNVTGQTIWIKKERSVGEANSEFYSAELSNALGIQGVPLMEFFPGENRTLFLNGAGEDIRGEGNAIEAADSAFRQDVYVDRMATVGLLKFGLLDILIANSDRHRKNFLIQKKAAYGVDDNGFDDWNILPIDHGFGQAINSGNSSNNIKEYMANGGRNGGEVNRDLIRKMGKDAYREMLLRALREGQENYLGMYGEGGGDVAQRKTIAARMQEILDYTDEDWEKIFKRIGGL